MRFTNRGGSAISARKTILGVFAHPDDECMGPGGTFAKYAREGHRVAFVTATDGGAGRLYKERPADNTELRQIRREETICSAETLGIEFLGFYGWHDRDLENMSALAVEKQIVTTIRREKPDVLVTFHGSGISYHPDHRIISMALMAAFQGAGHAEWYDDAEIEALQPHQPSKLYYYTAIKDWFDKVNWPRVTYRSPEGEVTTLVDTRDTADIRWQAILAHDTQRDGPPFQALYDAGMFNVEAFVRVFPSPRPGEAVETSLLDGLD